jgi:hypothetical protein
MVKIFLLFALILHIEAQTHRLHIGFYVPYVVKKLL